MFLEAGKPKIKALADSFPGASCLPALQMKGSSLCPHMPGEKAKKLCVSSYKVTNPIMRTPSS